MNEEIRNGVLKLLRSYRLTMTQDDDGNGYPLVDAVTPPGDAAITRGIEELEYLAEDISRTIEPLEAENKRLREALEARRDWFAAQLKSASKGNFSEWDRHALQIELDAANEALS